jgi:TPR repeat protein
MTEKYQAPKPAEADRLVDEFLERIVVRDASGNALSILLSAKEIRYIFKDARSPTIPDDLRESLDSLAKQAWTIDPGFESRLLARCIALPDVIRNGASTAYKQRLAALSPIDKLKVLACDPEDHPTEATVVAKMYLDGRQITISDAAYVGNLLEIAAERGNAEAAYLLATAKAPVKRDSGDEVEIFLTNTEYLRGQYLRQARAGNFRKIFEDEANAQYFDDDDNHNEEQLHYWQTQLTEDETCTQLEKSYSVYLKEAEMGFPLEQMAAGELLLQYIKHIEVNHTWLCKKCPTTIGKVKSLCNRAEHWLRMAAKHEIRARFLIAENFTTSQDERFSLLNSAAFPDTQVTGYWEAASPLACEFLMNAQSKHFDPEVGEQCLRTYLTFCMQDQDCDFFLDDGNAANCLADCLLARPNPTTEQKAEAFAWYRRSAESEFGLGSPHALIRAGLMSLRGEGCSQNHDLAKTFLQRARRPYYEQPRDRQASKYADITLRLGWGRWEFVAEELLELAEETEFLGDPLCPLIPEDIRLLVACNPYFRNYPNDDELTALRGRLGNPCGPFGEIPIQRLIVEGLIWVLQPRRTIPRERLDELWGDSRSMVECYARSRLEQAARICGSDMATLNARAKSQLEVTISLGNKMLDDKHREPLKYGERELVLRIARQASSMLDMLQKQREIEQKSKHEADAQIKVLAERTRLLSALSHTLNNSQVSSRQLVRSAVEILSRMESLTVLEEKAVNDLLSLHAKFDFTNNLIQTYKLLAGDPEKLAMESMAEQPGLPSIGGVVVEALQNAILKMVFEQSSEGRAYHLIGKHDYRALLALRAEFRNKSFFANDPSGGEQLLDWVQSCFPGLKIEMVVEAFGRPLHNITQRALIFSIVSELIANAMSYANQEEAISISLLANGEKYTLSVRNGYSGTGEIKKGNGGLAFINDLADKLTVPGYFDAQFLPPQIANGAFCAELLMTDERI